MLQTIRRNWTFAAHAFMRCSWFFALLITLMASTTVWSQDEASSPSPSIVTQECPRNQCFASVEERKAFGVANSCYFLEDICTDFDPGEQGADDEDRGFWGSLWDAGVGAIEYGYEFVKGLFVGLGDQITDLIGLLSDPLEAAKGLIELGKQFYDDPQGTIETLGAVIGQDLVNQFNQATQCGAYDLGRVIGQNINPVVILKVAGKLVQFGGRLDDAVRATKIDLGCASFVAGTPVLTPDGSQAIDAIQVGSTVLSRDDKTWKDAPKPVTNTFGRVAPSYRELTTEFETYQLTDEHPLWVQGKGWTEARDITDDDVVVSLRGDVRVNSNKAVAEPVQVYNFSVNETPNYFVGDAGLWVHNTTCAPNFRDYFLGTKKPKDLDSAKKGYWGELNTKQRLEAEGYEAKVAVGDGSSGFGDWVGQTGIDGIYKKDGKWVIVESKTTGSTNVRDPCDTTGSLCTLTGGERQMSDQWIIERVNSNPNLTQAEKTDIINGLGTGNTSRVLAKTDGDGNTTFNEILPTTDAAGVPSTTDVRVGGTWTP